MAKNTLQRILVNELHDFPRLFADNVTGVPGREQWMLQRRRAGEMGAAEAKTSLGILVIAAELNPEVIQAVSQPTANQIAWVRETTPQEYLAQLVAKYQS